MNNKYEFTSNWFEACAKPIWDKMFTVVQPKKVLEVGCFEGMCTTYVINKLKHIYDLEIHCVDNWGGNGIENTYNEMDMSEVESRFDHNIKTALQVNSNIKVYKHKGNSEIELSKLMCTGYTNYFDMVYIDGSHTASDVLLDSVLGFKLLKVGGIMIFDDYIWNDEAIERNVLKSPKIAIDSFVNINYDKIKIVREYLGQFYISKQSN